MKSDLDRTTDALAETVFSRLSLREKRSRDARSIPKIDLTSFTDSPSESNSIESRNAEEPPRDTAQDDSFVNRIETDQGPVWVSRNAIMCACPDCQAPVSVRTWLMLADCWNCEIAIELSQQQQEAVEKLLGQQTVPTNEPPQHAEPIQPRSSITQPSYQPPPPAFQDQNEFAPVRLVQVIRGMLGALPAWLISFLVHVILILILALILIPSDTIRETITLTTFVSEDDREGGEKEFRIEDDPLQFDSMLPNVMELDDEEWRDEVQKALDDAKELTPTEETPPVEIENLKKNMTQRQGPTNAFLVRDPRLRNEILTQQGGTKLSEAAVARGLRWLAEVQNHDGSWSLSNYSKHANKRNKGDAAGTSLALLPFLGAGQTHEVGKYRTTVQKGLKWLLDHQKSNGDLRNKRVDSGGMYVHGQATIVLAEALSMTGDEHLREPCKKAIKFIEDAQHRNGGWRYKPGQIGDTSVLGWQIMALQSAKNSNSGIEVDRSTLKLAGHFLDQVGKKYPRSRDGYEKFRAGSLYRYLPDQRSPTPAMTAEALLCRFYLGWDRNDPRVMQGVSWMMKNLPGDEFENGDGDDKLDLYYWYYGTQVMHHYGGKDWKRWNQRCRDLLYLLQEKDGKYAGSWKPTRFKWGSGDHGGGRIYTTSLAVCTLEVYYRHLPLFDRIEFDD